MRTFFFSKNKTKVNNVLFPSRSSAITSACPRKMPSLTKHPHRSTEQRTYESYHPLTRRLYEMIHLSFSVDFLLEGLKLNLFNLKHDFPKPKNKNNAYTIISLPNMLV
jgi:hypothetical protein